MASWDVFRSEAGDVRRGLSTEALRAALAGGALESSDLARPAGSKEPWTPIAAIAVLMAPEPSPATAPPAPRVPAEPEPTIELAPASAEALAIAPRPPATPPAAPPPVAEDEDDVFVAEAIEPADPGDSVVAMPVATPPPAPRARPVAPPPAAVPEAVLLDPEALTRARTPEPRRKAAAAGAADPLEPGGAGPLDGIAPVARAEDEEDEDFSLSGNRHEEMEDLDLAAMVDIAMQLVMFFLVTSAVVFFRSLEIPPPDPDKAQAAAARQAPRDLKDLEESNILVEIDAKGQILVDHEAIRPEALAPKLRAAREASGRTAMLLMADLATPHRNAVLAYDAANEVGLAIKIGKAPAGGGPGG